MLWTLWLSGSRVCFLWPAAVKRLFVCWLISPVLLAVGQLTDGGSKDKEEKSLTLIHAHLTGANFNINKCFKGHVCPLLVQTNALKSTDSQADGQTDSDDLVSAWLCRQHKNISEKNDCILGRLDINLVSLFYSFSNIRSVLQV